LLAINNSGNGKLINCGGAQNILNGQTENQLYHSYATQENQQFASMMQQQEKNA